MGERATVWVGYQAAVLGKRPKTKADKCYAEHYTLVISNNGYEWLSNNGYEAAVLPNIVCFTFLHCMFSNVPSNGLLGRMQTAWSGYQAVVLSNRQ